MASYSSMAQYLGTLGRRPPARPATKAYQPNYGEREGPVPGAAPSYDPNWLGGTATVPGQAAWEPDWASAITGSWDYQQALQDMQGADTADTAAINNAIRSQAVNFGGDLSDMLKGGFISKADQAAAQNNQFSFMAELGKALGRQNVQDVSDLAGRGGANSGATEALAGRRQEDYQRQSTQGRQNLLSGFQQMRLQGAARAADRRSQLQMVRANIAARLAADPRYQPREGTASQTATYNPRSGTYDLPDGTQFDPGALGVVPSWQRPGVGGKGRENYYGY
jgi:hypothetical protein